MRNINLITNFVYIYDRRPPTFRCELPVGMEQSIRHSIRRAKVRASRARLRDLISDVNDLKVFNRVKQSCSLWKLGSFIGRNAILLIFVVKSDGKMTFLRD